MKCKEAKKESQNDNDPTPHPRHIRVPDHPAQAFPALGMAPSRRSRGGKREREKERPQSLSRSRKSQQTPPVLCISHAPASFRTNQPRTNMPNHPPIVLNVRDPGARPTACRGGRKRKALLSGSDKPKDPPPKEMENSERSALRLPLLLLSRSLPHPYHSSIHPLIRSIFCA